MGFYKLFKIFIWFQHTAARRRLAIGNGMYNRFIVSTHSRPKAAEILLVECSPIVGFNTQPPEGGCYVLIEAAYTMTVSTHSRPKAAAAAVKRYDGKCKVSTHSRPKAAASCAVGMSGLAGVSTHSRPKAAAPSGTAVTAETALFQHTAARRRLSLS